MKNNSFGYAEDGTTIDETAVRYEDSLQQVAPPQREAAADNDDEDAIELSLLDEDMTSLAAYLESETSKEFNDERASKIKSPSAERKAITQPKTEAAAAKALAEAGVTTIELIATRSELRRVEQELENQNQSLHTSNQELQRKCDELKNAHTATLEVREQLARLQIDFENFRRRAERTRAESHAEIIGETIKKLLPVVDNLQRALDNRRLAKEDENCAPDFEQFADGIELINAQLHGVLQSYGVESILSVGEQFNPAVHEAIAIDASGEFATQTVTTEIVRGYRIGERLVRPALVKVAQ